MNLDRNKIYRAEYEFVYFADKHYDQQGLRNPAERKVFRTTQAFIGLPDKIAQDVKYHMGHYGAIQGKLLGELHEVTN